MALIALRQLLDHAAENDYGVPAFNVNNGANPGYQQAATIVSPVILQASAGARKYAGEPFLRKLMKPLLNNSLIFRFACIRITECLRCLYEVNT